MMKYVSTERISSLKRVRARSAEEAGKTPITDFILLDNVQIE